MVKPQFLKLNVLIRKITMSEVEIFRIFWIICSFIGMLIMHRNETLTYDMTTLLALLYGPIFVGMFLYVKLFRKIGFFTEDMDSPEGQIKGYLAAILSMVTTIVLMVSFLPMDGN